MIQFATRDQITSAVLKILMPDHSKEDLHKAKVTWWQNFRSTGGFGLTFNGSKAFQNAEIEYQEYEISRVATVTGLGYSSLLDKKMIVPYYFYVDKGIFKIKVYDSRVSMLIVLYDSVMDYVNSLPSRLKDK